MEQTREKLQIELTRLKKQYEKLMNGRMIPSSRAQLCLLKYQALQKEIKRIDTDATERLALEKLPIDDVLEIIAIPLLADVMNDLVASVDGILRHAGAQETVFGIYTSQIKKAAMAMVDTLDNTEGNLPKLLEVDDSMVDAIRKKIMSFIKQRLNITK